MSNDLHDLLVPYALDALDPHERDRFESHLDQCDVCSAELAGFEQTAVRLGDAVATAPPATMRADVLDRVRTTPQERPVTLLTQRQRLRRTLPRLAVAACLLVAAAGVGGYVVEHQRVGDLQSESDRITSVMSADDAAMARVPVRGGGELRVMHSPAQGDAVVVGSALTQLDDDEVYQVWTMHDGTPRSVGLLGRSSSALFVPKTEDPDAFAVTVEPRGGSEQPTSEPIAVVNA